MPEKRFSGGGWILIFTIVMMVLIFVLLRLLTGLRSSTERELKELFRRAPDLYLERLENNKRFRLLFRRSELLLLRLEGYMATGQEEKIRDTIRQLDGMRLPPRDQLEFCQQRLSYFVSVRDREEALASREKLAGLLKKTKADKEESYQKILQDADQIIGVFLDRDTGLLPELTKQAGQTEDPVQRGILQYRIAILYHFSGDSGKTRIYLKRAGKNLKNTSYAGRIEEALEDETALERQ